MILAISDLQVTPILLTKFQVNWPFCSGEEVQNRFSRRQLWRPSWTLDRNDFSYFDLQVAAMLQPQFQINLFHGLRVVENVKS